MTLPNGSEPACPSEEVVDGRGQVEGMSLRDWFAGQALAQLHGLGTIEEITERCYEIADGMLEAREVPVPDLRPTSCFDCRLYRSPLFSHDNIHWLCPQCIFTRHINK